MRRCGRREVRSRPNEATAVGGAVTFDEPGVDDAGHVEYCQRRR